MEKQEIIKLITTIDLHYMVNIAIHEVSGIERIISGHASWQIINVLKILECWNRQQAIARLQNPEFKGYHNIPQTFKLQQ